MVIWLTGLPGSGKTTLAKSLRCELKVQNKQVILLDGDELRDVLNDFNYDQASRKKLANTYAKLARMLSLQGYYVICATVSMFHSVRDWNSKNIDDYFEIYLKVDNKILKHRNQKGLHSKASQGLIDNVHGYDIGIEEPINPHLTLDNNGQFRPNELVTKIMKRIYE